MRLRTGYRVGMASRHRTLERLARQLAHARAQRDAADKRITELLDAIDAVEAEHAAAVAARAAEADLDALLSA